MLVHLEVGKAEQGVIQAEVTCAGEQVTKGTLDYCISYCVDMGYRIDNAHAVLIHLHQNATFVGY